MKDHEIRETVSRVQELCFQFRDSQQLRERIANFLVPVLKATAATPQPTTQFEAWAKLHHYDLVRCSHEPYAAYRSDLTNAALAGWRGANGGAAPQATGWYERLQAECTRDHGEYPEDGALADRLRWWVPKSARHGSTTLEDDLREAADSLSATAPQATAQVISPVCPHPCRYAHSIDYTQIAGPKEGE